MHKLLLACLFFIFSCNNAPADFREQAEQEIKKADMAMSDQASKEGFQKTLLAFADDSAVKYEAGHLPIIGKTALKEFWAAQPETKAISWKPFKVEAAASGDLGYTLGYWKYISHDTTLHGSYYTIWKKQADGSWKFVLDGGNGTPAPE